MTAYDALRRNKINIIKILSTGHENYMYILNKVNEIPLITQHEYNNLTSINKEDVQGHVIKMLDKIMNKGEEFCDAFLKLLRTDKDITDTFPSLKGIQWECTHPSSTPIQSCTDAAPWGPSTSACSPFSRDELPPESKRQKKDEPYLLTSKPTGLCIIINNERFEDGTMRSGTNTDAQSLAEVFSWLGFRVLMCKDQTSDQMSRALKIFASLQDFCQMRNFNIQEWSGSRFSDLQEIPRHGDAFICCILSHGVKGAVKGTDGKLVAIKDIMATFNGSKCSSLINKPKVFLIQACQGQWPQHGVAVPDLEADVSPQYIPVEADFLVAIATVEDYVSFRHRTDGSWFIQSVCQQLKEGCQRGDDIKDILCRVNSDVSMKEGSKCSPGTYKQMSEFKVTLRKRLVFSPQPNRS